MRLIISKLAHVLSQLTPRLLACRSWFRGHVILYCYNVKIRFYMINYSEHDNDGSSHVRLRICSAKMDIYDYRCRPTSCF